MALSSKKMPCTCEEQTACGECGLGVDLGCRWDFRILLRFWLMFLPFGLLALAGLVVVGRSEVGWWPLWVYGAFFVLFFGVLEIRILCSHCPFYAREGVFLRCLGNHGMPRLWRWRPEPMARWENILLAIGFLFFLLFPAAVPILTGAGKVLPPVLGGATLLAGIAFFAGIRRFHCRRCVNFSCFLNLVPIHLRDAYLARNPVLAEAWQSNGTETDI